MDGRKYDVAVIGGGNAALCAALSAQESGARVLVLERAPEEESGGNSRFTAGAIRFAYRGLDDLREVVSDLTDEEIANTDFGSYDENQFLADMFRVTQYRCDPDLVEILVRQSRDTLIWMRKSGLRFVPIYGRQAFKVDGKFKFWGGLSVEAVGGGPGLVDSLTRIARSRGVEIWYGARATALEFDGEAVTGVVVRREGGRPETVAARAVIVASGGFEANPQMRTAYLGPGWEMAKVRGTRFNTGDGINMALEIGAAPYGNWSGCHAVGWDLNAPSSGPRGRRPVQSTPIRSASWSMPRAALRGRGRRLPQLHLCQYGRAVLSQPRQFAWQVFDAKVKHLLRDEYKIKQVTKAVAPTLKALAEKLEGVDAKAFLAEVEAYNRAVQGHVPFNPNVKDGRGTVGLAVNKSNWANTIDEGPFEAYAVTCGITFTFGGLRISPDAQVLDTDLRPIPGLYAAGELVGGLFYFNYPGGTGLMSGSVFGRIAGRSAATAASESPVRLAANK